MPADKRIKITLTIDKVHYHYVTIDSMLANASDRIETFMLNSKAQFIKLDDGTYVNRKRIDSFTYEVIE